MSSSNRPDKEIELRFYEIIECFADPICLLDSRLYIRYVNKSFITLLGLEYHEVISRPFTEFIPADRVHETAERLGKVLSSPDTVVNLEIQFRNGSNVWLDLELCAKNICNQLNQGMIVMHLKDITGHKLAEEERERLQSQLIQAQKMESIGRLAGGVAHDFNNMLLVILGHAELLADKLPHGDSMQTDLNQIKKAAHRSADLTRQLLAFARKQVIAPKPLDLNQTTESLLKMLNV
jgi:PAS domain S-box-containing protein